MKNAFFLFLMGFGVVVFGQNPFFQNSIPIHIQIDSCLDDQDGCCFGPHRLKKYYTQKDSVYVDVNARIGCAFEPWHDSLFAVKRSDTLYIKKVARKKYWDGTGIETCCYCCHHLRFSLKNDFKKTPVIFIDRQQLLLQPFDFIEKRYAHPFLEMHQDTLNHRADESGYIGSYMLEKFKKEGLPWQFIQRPMLEKGEKDGAQSISPIGLFIYHKGDTIIESIDGIEHSLALKVSVNGRIIETRFAQGYWFRSIPGKAGRMQSVEVVFPDGHIERWP
ncbi:MAG: hypothetical protein R3B47_10715 [Bacteroidia bacterium]